MKIDVVERAKECKRKEKLSLIMTIVFAVLTLACIACFIIFSNYKIQLMMSIVGSISASILVVITIIMLIGGYLYNKYLFNFYSQLESKEEQSVEGKLKVSEKYVTLKKGLSFLAVYINEQEYYLADEGMNELLKDGDNYKASIRGNYVTEMMKYE